MSFHMIIKSNPITETKVSDPLAEALEKTLPTFARKLKINHYSPTQFAIPDAAWLFKYVFMDQKMRRELLPSNAAMESGKIVGEVLQRIYADTIYKLHPVKKKVAATTNEKITKDAALQEEIEKLKEYVPNDEKDSDKKQKYLEEIKVDSTVSVHIRRGDYIEKQNVANNFANVTATYFDDAIKYISSKVKIDKLVVFSDDIQWVKDNLRFDYECIYIENDGPDFQHQYLMSQCNHNIISNSTYSWWGAWLNPDKEKIVCVPGRWFADEKRKNDIYIPNSWVRLEKN